MCVYRTKCAIDMERITVEVRDCAMYVYYKMLSYSCAMRIYTTIVKVLVKVRARRENRCKNTFQSDSAVNGVRRRRRRR